jgi:hypothetical protein
MSRVMLRASPPLTVGHDPAVILRMGGILRSARPDGASSRKPPTSTAGGVAAGFLRALREHRERRQRTDRHGEVSPFQDLTAALWVANPGVRHHNSPLTEAQRRKRLMEW